MDAIATQKCHLLSLPKELRLEIWKWTLTDPSTSNLTVNIGRDKKDPCYYTARGIAVPRVTTWLQPARNRAIEPSVLRTNHFIYDEALPLLYQSAKFALADHHGIFPLWLASLSPYARSFIRYIKLHAPQQVYNVDLFDDPAVPLFHWAVTCAQVAQLSGQLKEVEVDGLYMENLSPKVRRSILHPLCGIKARKVFGEDNHGDTTVLMASAEQVVELKSARRKEQAEARAKAQAKRKERGTQDEEGADEKKQKKGADGQQRKLTIMEQGYRAFPRVSRRRISRDLSTIPGIVVFRRELAAHTMDIVRTEHNPVDDTDADTLSDGWDMINFEHGQPVSSGSPPSYSSRRSSDSWSDASTIITEVRNLVEDEELLDTESWDAESVTEQSVLLPAT